MSIDIFAESIFSKVQLRNKKLNAEDLFKTDISKRRHCRRYRQKIESKKVCNGSSLCFTRKVDAGQKGKSGAKSRDRKREEKNNFEHYGRAMERSGIIPGYSTRDRKGNRKVLGMHTDTIPHLNNY